jgi:tetratricopeptide (TPR) repeat protein
MNGSRLGGYGSSWVVILCLLFLVTGSLRAGDDDALSRASSLLEENRYSAARKAALEHLAKHPKSAQGHFIAGVAAMKLGKLERAEKHLDAADRREPGMPELEYNLGELARLLSLDYLRRGKEKISENLAREAVEHYQAELARVPNHAGALAGRARLLADRGELEGAIEAHESWIRANPDNPEAYLALARLYAEFGRAEDALTALRRRTGGGGAEEATTRYAVARSLFEAGKTAEGSQLLERIREQEAGSWRVAGLEAIEAVRSGRPFLGEEALARFLGNEPPPAEVERIVEAYYLGYAELVRSGGRSRLGAETKLPELALSVVPKYPQDAQTYGVNGKVLLLARVGADGVPDPVTVVSCTVSKRPTVYVRQFRDSAADAVGQWRFSPAVRDGKPVVYTVPIRLEFSKD